MPTDMLPAQSEALRRLTWSLVGILVAFAAFLAHTLRSSHDRYEAVAVTALHDLTLILERHLFGQLQAADLVLQSAARTFQELDDEPEVRARAFTAWLAGASRQLPLAPAIRAADAAGDVLYGPGLDRAQRLSVARRQFFIDASADPGLVIGLPVKSRVSQRWVLPLARQLRDAAGQSAGVVYLNLDLEQYARTLDELSLGKHGVITIFNSRREVLLRRPDLLLLKDEEPVLLTAPQTVAALAAGRSTALFDTESSIDQVLRTLMYRKVQDYPTYVLAGIPRSEILAAWRIELAAAAFVWLVLAASTFGLLRAQRRAASTQARALAEVNAAMAHAEAANKAKSAFLANMSHEIRTPMNAIIGLAHLLTIDSRDRAQRQRLGKIDVAARHLLQVINDILDLSKVEAGKVELEDVDFDLDEILSRAFEMVRGMARDKGIELVLEVEGLPSRLRGDPMRLTQCLVNLLANAVKFTQRGWVRLRGQWLREEGARLLVRFEVQDTGRGIAPEQQAALFGMFEQADSTTPRQHGGTGLGLALTRQFAALMGGEAGLSSLPGQGSRFWFTAWFGRVAEPTAAAPTEPTGWGPVTLMGDVPESVAALAGMLRRLGIEPVVHGEVSASADPVTSSAVAPPGGTVLVSSALPPAACLVGLRRLRDRLGENGPPIVLVTDFDDAPPWAEAGKGLGLTLLAKPATATALRRVLEGIARGDVAGTELDATGSPQELLRLRHAGKRILLVEDNPVNEEVAVELLSLVGFDVDTAGDGAQALEMAQEVRYDAILMDVQMPVLDGMSATRALRSRDADAPPVIAMTASAFGEDRDACLAAGMSDHLSKPVDPQRLYACLLRWLAPGHPGRTVSAAQRDAAADSPQGASLQGRLAGVEGFDLSQVLRNVGGSVNLLERAIGAFVRTYRDGIPALADKGARGDVSSWRLACHSLRGATATVGATALLTEIARLEAALDAPAIPEATLEEQARRLDRQLVELARSLEAALDAIPRPVASADVE